MHCNQVNQYEIYLILKIFDIMVITLKPCLKIIYLQITSIKYGQKIILEKLRALSSGLYYTYINPIESNMVSNQKLLDKDMFILWHDRLGHPGNIMILRKII